MPENLTIYKRQVYSLYTFTAFADLARDCHILSDLGFPELACFCLPYFKAKASCSKPESCPRELQEIHILALQKALSSPSRRCSI